MKPRQLILEDNQGRIERFRSLYPDAIIVSTVDDATTHFVSDETWDLVSLDHDLNNEIFVDSSRADCGAQMARNIVVLGTTIKSLIIHTANEGAAYLMAHILADYKPELKPFEGSYDPRSTLHMDKYKLMGQGR